MRKLLFGIWACVLLIGVGPASGQEVIDQEQPVIDATVGGFAVGGFYHQTLAQVFTAGATASLVGIELPLECDPTGTVTLQIVTVVSGVPTGTALSAVSVPSSALPYTYPDPPSFHRINLATAVSQSAGQQYAFTIGADTNCGIYQGPAGNPYAGGDGFSIDDVNGGYGTGWFAIGDHADLPFRTVTETTTPKVSIRHHDTQWICVNASALGAHLAHGDTTWFRGCTASK